MVTCGGAPATPHKLCCIYLSPTEVFSGNALVNFLVELKPAGGVGAVLVHALQQALKGFQQVDGAAE